VNQYSDDGLQLLIVVSATDDFNGTPTPEYCAELQATQLAHVLYDPNAQVTGVLGIRINMGSAILDGNGIWVTGPVGDDSYQTATSALRSLFGGGFGW
jgi:hypothetical protein